MFNFFGKKSIGLEIADRSIEVLELKKHNNVEILNTGRIKFGPGIVERGRIKDEKKLQELLFKVFNEAQPKKINYKKEIVFGLPESQVYTYVFILPSNEGNREEYIQEEIKKNIPLSIDELVYSYKVLSQKEKGEEIVVVASKKKVVLEWKTFFEKNKINVKIFDIETLATFRGLLIEKEVRPICIIDIGSVTTNVSIFDQSGLRYSHSIFKAGDFFTQKIADKLKVSFDAAEKKKIKADLLKKGKVNLVLKKELKIIAKEIQLILEYFKKHIDDKPQLIIFVGGSSKIKGLAKYMSSCLKKEVFTLYSVAKKKNTDLVFLETVGLALRNIDKSWDKKDPILK